MPLFKLNAATWSSNVNFSTLANAHCRDSVVLLLVALLRGLLKQFLEQNNQNVGGAEITLLLFLKIIQVHIAEINLSLPDMPYLHIYKNQIFDLF